MRKDCFYREILSTETTKVVPMNSDMLEERYSSLGVDLGWRVWVAGGIKSTDPKGTFIEAISVVWLVRRIK